MATRERVYVNFFKPNTPTMRSEVAISRVVIVFWAVLSFGLPILVWFAGQGDPSGLGESFLTRSRFLGFPLHYWLIAQGCTIGYILLCKLYCALWETRVVNADWPSKGG